MKRLMVALMSIVGVVASFPPYGLADEARRDMLKKSLVEKSPWNFSNQDVYLVLQWRTSPEGKLEPMYSHRPDVWTVEEFTADDTLVRPSTAGGNTVTFYLDEHGQAAHSLEKPLRF